MSSNNRTGQETLRDILEREKKSSHLNSVLAYKWYMEVLCSEFKAEDGEPSGGKSLLLDKETMTMMSMVYSMTEALKHDVYFMEKLGDSGDKASENDSETTRSLECIVFIRPTDMNVENLRRELKNPRYARYHIVWNNMILEGPQGNAKHVGDIAKADEYQLVASMKEFYGDFYAVHDQLFHFDLPQITTQASQKIKRTVDGLMSMLLAHKRNPCIKFQGSSDRARDLAEALEARISDQGNDMPTRQPNGAPTLFIFDRREDPVTPLLKSWTYQSMIHELIGITHNRVKVPSSKKGEPAVNHVINPGFKLPPAPGSRAGEYRDEAQDEFFANHMFENFGEIGLLLKDEIEKSALSSKLKNAKGASVEELQELVAEMPEMRHKNMIAMKHWDIFRELKRQVDDRFLFEMSTIEQNLACREEHETAKEEVEEALNKLLQNDCQKDALRMVMLYLLRYEDRKSGKKEEFIEMLHSGGLEPDYIAACQAVLEYGGKSKRTGPGAKLMGNEQAAAKLFSGIRANMELFTGATDVNDLTQHTPLIVKILDDLVGGKLGAEEYPEIGMPAESNPKEIIIFIVGGATYAEAAFVKEWSNAHPDVKVLIGGTCIHSSTSFIENELQAC